MRSGPRLLVVVGGFLLAGCSDSEAEKVQRARQGLGAGAEIALDPEQMMGPALGGGSLVSLVERMGGGYAASWCAEGAGFLAARYVARLDASGAAVDTAPLLLADECDWFDSKYEAALARSANGTVVVFPETASSALDHDLFSARFGNDGTLVQNGPIVSAADGQTDPALAASGSGLLLVWQDNRAPATDAHDIYAHMLDANGLPSGAEIEVAVAAGDQVAPAVAFDGTSFLVAWMDGDDVRGVHVTPTGNVVEASPLTLATHPDQPGAPELVFNGTNYLLSLGHGSPISSIPGGFNVRALSPAGTPVGSVFEIEGASYLAMASLGSSSGASESMLAWVQSMPSSPSQFRALRVTANGAPVGPVTPPLGFSLSTESGTGTAIASDGSGYLAGWEVYYTASGAAQVVGISSAGVVGPVQLLSKAVNAQSNPDVVFDGTNLLVTWQDQRGNDADLRGVRMEVDGTVLDAPSLAMTQEPGRQTDASLARSKSATLLASEDYDPTVSEVRRRAAVVDGSGQVGAMTVVGEAAGPIWSKGDVASDGESFLVVSGAQGVHARKLDASGAPVTSELLVFDSFSPGPLQPAVAWGGHYLVTWAESYVGIQGVRIGSEGQLVDSLPFTISGTEVDASMIRDPAVAFGAGVFLVVYQEASEPYLSTFARRVSVDGALLDATPLELPGLGWSEHHAAVHFDGTSFLVAYGTDGGINVVSISPAGVLGTESVSFAGAGLYTFGRTLSLGGKCGAETVATYSRAALTSGLPNERVFARILSPDSSPTNPDCTIPPTLTPSTGGSAGAAGAAGASGSAGAGGSGATGGAGGTSTGGVAGNAGTGAGGPRANPTADEGGCGCRIDTRSQLSLWPLVLLGSWGVRRSVRRRVTTRRWSTSSGPAA